jgi:predicted PurR-regulated permease PerM
MDRVQAEVGSDGLKAPSAAPVGPAPGALLAWSVLAAILYALRNVLLVAFLTFLLSYLVRVVVGALARRLRPRRESPGLERGLTLGVFLGLVTVAWGLGSLVGPQLATQSRLLLAEVRQLEPEETLTLVLAQTVGAYLFARKYGHPGEPSYQAGLNRFAAEGRAGEGAYAGFGRLQAKVQAGFEVAYAGAERQRLRDQLLRGGAVSQRFDRWFLTNKAPALVAAQRPAYLARWQAVRGEVQGPTPGGAELDQDLAQLALKDLDQHPAERARLVAEWEDSVIQEEWQRLNASAAYRDAFAAWYAGGSGQALGSPYDYPTYAALSEAYPEGLAAFATVYQARVAQTPAGDVLLDADFRRATEDELARAWWASSPTAAFLKAHLEQGAANVAENLAARVAGGVQSLIAIPAQIGTALFLTILVTFDMARLKQGALRLRHSRIAGFYALVVPHLVALARLIARSFAAQGLIAVFNTVFSLALFRLIGLDNEILLCSVVFIASFIPVLGVVISAIPIVLQALLQSDGSLTLALYALLGVAAIHTIETTILSPRIVGKVLHLHPVLVIAVLVIGEQLFGVWGLLLGVPVAVYLIQVGVLGEALPGVYEPAGSEEQGP